MKIKSILILGACALITSQGVFGFDDEEVGDLLRWFPIGAYDSFSSLDFEKMRSAEIYKEYSKYIERHMAVVNVDIFPPSFLGNIISVTTAHLVDYEEIDEKEQEDGGSGTGRDGIHQASRASDINIGFENDQGRAVDKSYRESGISLFVARYDELDILVKQAVGRGEISETGESAYGAKIYVFKARSGKPMYFYAADHEELLYCEDLRTLKRMIGAGFGESLILLDDPDYEGFKEVYHSLGFMWMCRDSSARHRLEYREAERLGAPEKTLQALKKKLEGIPRFNIITRLFTDKYVERWMRFYEDEATAGKVLDEELPQRTRPLPRGGLIELQVAYMDARRKSTVLRVEGNSVISETTFSSDFLEKQAEYEQWMKEKEKAMKR